MLNIRGEQIEAMSLPVRQDFHRRLMVFLRQELPEDTAEMDDAALLNRIQESEQRAARYGIASEGDISQFACLTFLGGPQFDEIPEVHEYLTEEDPDMDPEEKLEVLIDEIADQDEEDEA